MARQGRGARGTVVAATHLKAKANNVVRGLRVLAAEDPCVLLLELFLLELELVVWLDRVAGLQPLVAAITVAVAHAYPGGHAEPAPARDRADLIKSAGCGEQGVDGGEGQNKRLVCLLKVGLTYTHRPALRPQRLSSSPVWPSCLWPDRSYRCAPASCPP